jgi:hypothetical protein
MTLLWTSLSLAVAPLLDNSDSDVNDRELARTGSLNFKMSFPVLRFRSNPVQLGLVVSGM